VKLTVLGTGSKGNCYMLTDESGETLILDAGIKASDIKKALSFDFSNVAGVLVSHEHKDHCLAADELERYGLDVWRPYVWDDGRDRITLGKYAAESFPVEHDGTPCTGFYIRHINGFSMLYVTDYEYVKWNFSKLKVNSILCEANWMKEFVQTDTAYASHKILGHASLDVCKGFVESNWTENLQSVVICHTSNAIDVTQAVAEIKEIAGNEVFVDYAEKGKVFELGSN